MGREYDLGDGNYLQVTRATDGFAFEVQNAGKVVTSGYAASHEEAQAKAVAALKGEAPEEVKEDTNVDVPLTPVPEPEAPKKSKAAAKKPAAKKK